MSKLFRGIKKFYNLIFYFPSVDERKSVFKVLFTKLASNTYDQRDNDFYCYYICFVTTFFVNATLIFISILTFLFKIKIQFHFFAIDLTGVSYVENFLFAHAKHISYIIFFIFLPYFLVLFLKNVSLGELDLMRLNTRLSLEIKNNRWKMLSTSIQQIILFSFCIIFAYGLPLFLLNREILSNSALSLLISATFYLFCYPTFAFLLLSSVVSFVKYSFYFREYNNSGGV